MTKKFHKLLEAKDKRVFLNSQSDKDINRLADEAGASVGVSRKETINNIIDKIS